MHGVCAVSAVTTQGLLVGSSISPPQLPPLTGLPEDDGSIGLIATASLLAMEDNR